MFQVNAAHTKVIKFSPRMENHGDELQLAGDLKCETVLPRSVLDGFDPSLRKALYRKPDAKGEQGQLPMDDGLTELRMPRLAALQWDEKFPGYKASFESGLAVNDPIHLHKITVSKFAIEPLNGGSVRVIYNLSMLLDGRTSGKLCQLIQGEIELTLVPPTKEELAEMQKAEQRDIDDPE